MAEKLISPGVFTAENDLSFIPAGVGEIGGAIVGPTVKGPALVPTVVNSYAEYVQMFGDTFQSGSTNTEYLTSISAREYLKHSGTLTVVRVLGDSYSNASSNVTQSDLTGSSFTLNTIADGAIMNSVSTVDANGVLPSGSKDNLRWETTSVNNSKGTFTLLIRRGNDSTKHKVILETHSGLSLDPNSPNYISKRIGDQKSSLSSDGTYIQPTGNYPNKSAYVYVSGVADTIDFLDPAGEVRDATATGSLPTATSGTFDGGTNGTEATGAKAMFDDIVAANVQGLDPLTAAKGKTKYENAFTLLSNQDEYDINLLWAPGLNNLDHDAMCNKLIEACENRGDCFAIVDPVGHDKTLTNAVTQGGNEDSSYAAMYWPWVQTQANGKYVWVPASTLMPGVIAFNDKVSHEWYAPAGLNRGGLSSAIQAERKLTHANRDDLYEANINPIATFPGEGVCAWGQKTLQRKASALDRINVRRLLINLKKFIASTSRYLVFENNTAATRNRFLASVNPYMESVQEKNGLYAFKVVMDDTNNTPDIIDRNIMKGEIFLQPAKAAEFIVVDFNIMPTGATFED
jgi:phage tail sheath protein FI